MITAVGCLIREVHQEDLPMLLAWRNHQNVRQFMHTRHRISMDEHNAWFQRVSADDHRKLFLVEENGSPIGFVQFTRIRDGVAEWGFYANPEAHKGSGRRLACAALDHAFDKMGLYEIIGEVLPHNTRSIAFHQRLGFDEDAASVASSSDGNALAVHRFRLNAPSWRRNPK